MKKLPVAVQIFSIRDEAERDFKGTMEQVKAMGYDGVELAGLYGYSPEEIRDYIKNAGLKAISAHVPYQELVADMENTIEKYVTIGCEYIVVPYLTEEYRPGTEKFSEVVKNIEKIGEYCRSKNMMLLYHNHDFEFTKMEDGRYALDYLYDTVSADKLQTEIDTCWVKVSGVDPSKYIRKYANRSPVVHLKDFKGEKSDNMYELIGIDEGEKKAANNFEFRPVGYGVQNFKEILEAAVESGAKWVVVEQDAHYDNTAMEDIKLSRDYLTKLGW
ncbi:sugar phosphate isomerase/epimerase [Clostridium sp. SYSU_GA19001]|uniref:sugar phosphate isomerase/epimerase family protein n=1 Tax=Clostridium caldaquaticum TaxID=2940653 RepID=UPI00207713FA|nr:sugar phosphate isomerase/epimerase [Clostridium caldaquaticum]MCM8710732.1 sugar phosphate isomerase/epimerase [Clostridium caldaquaticum]